MKGFRQPSCKFILVLILIYFANSSWSEVQISVGVVVGNKNLDSADPSSAEKLCVFEALEKRYNIDFHLYENNRMLIKQHFLPNIT